MEPQPQHTSPNQPIESRLGLLTMLFLVYPTPCVGKEKVAPIHTITQNILPYLRQ